MSIVCSFLFLSANACTQDAQVSSERATDTGWIAMAEPSFPPLFQASAAWTDKGMLLWGTTDPELRNVQTHNAIYDPSSDRWRELPPGPLSPRFGQAAAWTGEELVVRGGGPRGGLASDGARFSLDPETWTVIDSGPLGPRSFDAAVWTGKEVLIWGLADDPFPQGAAYAPADDSWRVIAEAPIRARSFSTAVWTGEEMLLWGGVRVKGDREEPFADGAAYDPDGDSWRKLSPAPLTPRLAHTAIWTGSEMIVWGGREPSALRADGAAYDPVADSWRELPDAPLDGRFGHVAVWSGDKMFIWGGLGGEPFADGATYEPVSDRWSPLPRSPLDARQFPVGLWGDDELIIWGGTTADGSLSATGALYRP